MARRLGRVGPAVNDTTRNALPINHLLTKGAEAKKLPHKKAVVGDSADDVEAVADYLKTLK